MRSESSFGWFALSSALWIFFTSHVLAETAPFQIHWPRPGQQPFILYILCFCTYLLRFISVPPAGWNAIAVLTAVCILSIWSVSLGMMRPLFGTVFSLLWRFLLVYLYLCWVSVKAKRSDYIFLAVCAAAICIFAVFDVYKTYEPESHRIGPLSPYTSPLILPLIVMVILGARLAK